MGLRPRERRAVLRGRQKPRAAGKPGRRGLAGAGGLRLPDRQGPPQRSLQGLARAAGKPPSPQTGGGGAQAEPRRRMGALRKVGTLLTPTQRLTAPGREAAGAREGPRRARGVRLEGAACRQRFPSPGSAAAGYSRRAGRTWRAAASRGC